MKDCEDCTYESDMKEHMCARGYIFWASSESHPCTYCIRYPREPLTEDHYEQRSKHEPEKE